MYHKNFYLLQCELNAGSMGNLDHIIIPSFSELKDAVLEICNDPYLTLSYGFSLDLYLCQNGVIDPDNPISLLEYVTIHVDNIEQLFLYDEDEWIFKIDNPNEEIDNLLSEIEESGGEEDISVKISANIDWIKAGVPIFTENLLEKNELIPAQVFLDAEIIYEYENFKKEIHIGPLFHHLNLHENS
jgi:hypothetical protein